ncbi:heavy metal translocating P-type ATPase [Futiania mangrovi]|uniref:Heavy metal translocating P-type ATPase n=1 Tax=Futiania mangrovi TaxID=2959716 RepID=A0A9J6PCL4_9PROT|nr:heavy metal translocating P-type ATPase [Futiania mangrovii]MCP1335379.1 heavy metal translocating P-type ATPase [Futiania mangrovii]
MAGLIDGVETGLGDCCPTGDAGRLPDRPVAAVAGAEAFLRQGAEGAATLNLAVENMTCAACIHDIEATARSVPGVAQARVNYTNRRVVLSFDGAAAPAGEAAEAAVSALAGRGYRVRPFDADALASADAGEMRTLLRALGVAGFAAANVMLLSVAVWSGQASDMDPATQAFFHWMSALIALPAIAYAGLPFYRSAWAAIRGRRLNMDVPISLAVVVAGGMSLVQTALEREHVYFDASVTLLFFLLLGRVLDTRVRARARTAAQNLLALRSRAATRIAEDGSARHVAVEDLVPGDRVMVANGERIPADGTLAAGEALIDTSLITGEAVPRRVAAGEAVHAGTINLGAALMLTVTARDDRSLLAEIARLMENAEQGRAAYVRLADRVARAYAPVVHVLGAVTLAGWLIAGAGIEDALMTAVAVLIVTCPCALALAVPAVQVAAGGRLFRRGVLLTSGDALERLAEVDTVVFDKTGTLTTGELELVGADAISPADLALAARMAVASTHPLSRALAAAGRGVEALAPYALARVEEVPGKGLVAETRCGRTLRLGRRDFAGPRLVAAEETGGAESEIWLGLGDGRAVRFRFADRLRDDVRGVVQGLMHEGVHVLLLSGDRREAVGPVADMLGIADAGAGLSPAEKIARIAALKAEGRKVLMVGDGLNDAPALASADVSMSPSSASDLAQTAADIIFMGDKLAAVPEAMEVARRSRRLVWQNIALSFGYNAVAIPLAMAGYVTPLIAAVAMSSSSVCVTLNALRLGRGAERRAGRA